MAKCVITRKGFTATLNDHGYAYLRKKWDGKGKEPESIFESFAKFGGEIIPGVRWDTDGGGTIPDVWSDEAEASLSKWMDGQLKCLTQGVKNG